jgi:hypothetical protein
MECRGSLRAEGGGGEEALLQEARGSSSKRMRKDERDSVSGVSGTLVPGGARADGPAGASPGAPQSPGVRLAAPHGCKGRGRGSASPGYYGNPCQLSLPTPQPLARRTDRP